MTALKTMKVRLTFLEEVLGTLPNDEDIFRNFIARKAPDAATIEDEVAALGVDEVVDGKTTRFPRDKEGRPFLYDYQIKGFFKDACSMLARAAPRDEEGKRLPTSESAKLKAYRKIIDGLIFVYPRQVVIITDKPVGSCQRPLRAFTPSGERIALASSETVAEHSYADLEIKCLNADHFKAVKEWLDYGADRGLGQWRNSGKGRFTWEELA